MSYMRMGLRQSPRKNVLEEDLTQKINSIKSILNPWTMLKEEWKHKVDIKGMINNLRGSYLHFGTRLRNTQLIHPDGSRNYKNCLDPTGKFIKFNGDSGITV